MDHSAAIELLESSSPHQRLQGARFFTKNHLPDYLPELKSYHRKERVLHVKAALDLAIKRNTREENRRKKNENNDVEQVYDVTFGQENHEAVDKWVGILLHEIEPKVGLIKIAAQKEISNFEDSETNKYLDGLVRVLKGFSNLRLSTAPPKHQEFDLADLIGDILSQEPFNGVVVSVHGPKPFIIKSDMNLLQMAISNGIRNALEAVKSNKDKKEIVVTWGGSDVEDFVSILDNGPGFPKEATDFLFKIGNTSKEGHEGFGLAIISQALENLGGRTTLAQSKGGGARLKLRWEK